MEVYRRWFVYVVGAAAVLLIVISIGRAMLGLGGPTDTARWREEQAAEVEKKAKFEADLKATEERKHAEEQALFASLGSIECVVTLRHTVQKQPAQVAEEYKKQNLPVSGEIVRYAEIVLRSASTNQIFTYQSNPDFRLSSESMSDEYRTREFIHLRPQAEKCLAEYVSGTRTAHLGNTNILVQTSKEVAGPKKSTSEDDEIMKRGAEIMRAMGGENGSN